jgi:tetratricopeptide (TPR) repeat protein
LERGYDYLNLCYDHSRLVTHLYGEKNFISNGDFNRTFLAETSQNTNTKDEFLGYLADSKFENIIISGEGISYLFEDNLELFKRDLLKIFDDITVIIYVREPYSWLNSYFCQNVKHGIRFSEFNEDVLFHFDCKARAEKFISVFGKNNIICKNYAKNSLAGNDIVIDFYKTIGLDIQDYYVPTTVNKSLSSEVLHILDLINKDGILSGEKYGRGENASLYLKFIQLLKGIGNTKQSFEFLTPELVYTYFKNDLEWFKNEFGIDFERPEPFKLEKLNDNKLCAIEKIAALAIEYIKSLRIESPEFFLKLNKWSEELNDGYDLPQNFYSILANWALKNGYYGNSLKLLEECLTLYDGSAEIYYNLAFLYDHFNRLDESIAAIMKAISLEDDNGSYHSFLGDLLQKKNDISGAVSAYEAADKFDPSLLKPQIQLSLLYEQLGKNDLAIAKVKQAIAIEGDDYFFYFHLGKLLKNKNDIAEAIEVLKKAKHLDPQCSGPHIYLSLIYEELNNDDLAVEEALNALSIKSKNSFFNYHYGKLLMKKGDLTGAKDYFEKAIEFDPSLAGPYVELSCIYNELGDIDSAIAKGEEAVSKKGVSKEFEIYLQNLLRQRDRSHHSGIVKTTIKKIAHFFSSCSNTHF